MAYGDHDYTREEVHQILYDSERRLRPSAPVDRAHEGHAISRHTEQREDPFDRRSVRQDSTFVSRKHMILAVHEALNSTTGKIEIRKLNRTGTKTVRVDAPIVEYAGKIFANVVHSPMARVRRRNVPAEGPQQLVQGVAADRVKIIVDRLEPAEGNKDIHIQTAYPA